MVTITARAGALLHRLQAAQAAPATPRLVNGATGG